MLKPQINATRLSSSKSDERRFKPTALCLILLSTFIVIIRSFSFDDPPEWDIGTYLAVGHQLNGGAKLYSDIWDSKPPGIFATYALAERITGYGQREIFFLSVAAAIVTMLGVWSAASIEGTSAGLWAAALFGCVCFEPTSGANLPNTEVFINAASVWAIALLLRMRPDGLQATRTIAIGLLFAAATLYKQVALAPAACLAIAHVIRPPQGMLRRRAIVQSIVIGAVGIAVWSLVFGCFAATGRGRLFYQTIFVYPRYYSGAVAFDPIDLLRVAKSSLRFIAPLAAAALLVFLRTPQGSPRRNRMILLAATIGTYLAIVLPRHFWDHYYQLWFPILAIAAGWGIARLTMVPSLRPWLGHTLGAIVAATLIWPQLSWFALDREGWMKRKYPGFFVRAHDDASEIDRLLLPGERVYAWSDEAWIYFAIRRSPPAAGLWKSHTLEGPLAAWLSNRTVEQLEKNPPELFANWETLPTPEDHPIARFLRARYRELPDGKTRWPFKYYMLRGGALERRLAS